MSLTLNDLRVVAVDRPLGPELEFWLDNLTEPATVADLVEVAESLGGEVRFKPDGTKVLVLKLADPSPTVPWIEQEMPDE